MRFTTQLLDHDAKRLHLFHQMFHAEEGFLASTCESMIMHIDHVTRRPGPFRTVVQERLATLQQLNGQERADFARGLGLSEKDVELFLSPGGCGKLSEADLERFAAGTPEMSVGFVSTAAGVLLVAQLLRYLHLGASSATSRGMLAVATFARAKLRTLHTARDQACDCAPNLRTRWHSCWPASYHA